MDAIATALRQGNIEVVTGLKDCCELCGNELKLMELELPHPNKNFMLDGILGLVCTVCAEVYINAFTYFEAIDNSNLL